MVVRHLVRGLATRGKLESIGFNCLGFWMNDKLDVVEMEEMEKMKMVREYQAGPEYSSVGRRPVLVPHFLIPSTFSLFIF